MSLSDINKSIIELRSDYERNQMNYFTENDLVSSLYTILNRNLDKKWGLHSELRPYRINRKRMTLDGKNEWTEINLKSPSAGARVDLAVISRDEKYFEDAKTTAGNRFTRYWRLPLYPIEAFQAAIELKVRVSGNLRAIIKDIEKLSKIRLTNAQCQVFLLVFDRKGDPRTISEIRELAQANEINFISFP